MRSARGSTARPRKRAPFGQITLSVYGGSAFISKVGCSLARLTGRSGTQGLSIRCTSLEEHDCTRLACLPVKAPVGDIPFFPGDYQLFHFVLEIRRFPEALLDLSRMQSQPLALRAHARNCIRHQPARASVLDDQPANFCHRVRFPLTTLPRCGRVCGRAGHFAEWLFPPKLTPILTESPQLRFFRVRVRGVS